jgi:hypothetical protein
MKCWTAACALALAAGLSGCQGVDPYAKPWQLVELGQSHDSVLGVMGTPSSSNVMELPLIKVEQTAWKTITGRVYLASFVLDRAVAKVIIE